MIPNYTTVCGVDKKHLQQLAVTWPTWKKHKPSLLNYPMIIFREWYQTTEEEVRTIVDHPDLSIFVWPPIEDDGRWGIKKKGKWDDPQRHKMLAGFVFIPGIQVKTPYWLKLDTDTTATGQDDWIDPDWFRDDPAIISHPWGFTKPGNQMLKLDQWVEENRERLPKQLVEKPPLNLVPREGASRISHKRIISWVAFFSTEFTRGAGHLALRTSTLSKRFTLPVPSQDGLLWYLAKRCELPIVRAGMKSRGWKHRNTMRGIEDAVNEAMGESK